MSYLLWSHAYMYSVGSPIKVPPPIKAPPWILGVGAPWPQNWRFLAISQSKWSDSLVPPPVVNVVSLKVPPMPLLLRPAPLLENLRYSDWSLRSYRPGMVLMVIMVTLWLMTMSIYIVGSIQINIFLKQQLFDMLIHTGSQRLRDSEILNKAIRWNHLWHDVWLSSCLVQPCQIPPTP